MSSRWGGFERVDGLVETGYTIISESAKSHDSFPASVCVCATKGGAEFHAAPQVVAAALGCTFWKIKIWVSGRFVLSGPVKPTTGGAQLEKQLSLGCGAKQPGVKLLAHLCTEPRIDNFTPFVSALGFVAFLTRVV
jgi:hypothetical protein